MLRPVVWVLVGVVGASACSGEASPMAEALDGSVPRDARAPNDATHEDAAPVADAGDTERVDASASVDAGTSMGCGVAHEAGFTCTTAEWGGSERTYCVEVPAGYDATRPHTLVLGLHGCGGSPMGARSNTSPQVDEGAGEMLFVYPKALGSCWEYTGSAATDVDFVRHVLDEVSSTHCVRRDHVFAEGMSSGGMMTSRLLCDGVADAGAAISLNYGCATPRPVWLYGGTADEYFTSYIEPGRDRWRRVNGCSETTRPLPEGPCVEYEGCTHRTIWCSDTRGHVWPREPWTAQIVDLFRSVRDGT